MSELPFPRIAILGTGLIGGSFALAVRKLGAHVTGYDRADVLAQARETGALDAGAADVASAVAGADLIVVALPIGASLDVFPTVAKHAREDALVTDVCSSKVRVCEIAASAFRKTARFLGGHPMAGRENGGIANANANLFQGAKYALMASEADTDVRVAKFAALVRSLGATPVWLDAETHDWAAAIVSHLPQLVAVALASVAQDETDETGLPLALAGSGLRDTLRLAGSPYDVWRDICHSNADNLQRALDRLMAALDHLRNNLKSRELEKEFQTANDVYKSLQRMK